LLEQLEQDLLHGRSFHDDEQPAPNTARSPRETAAATPSARRPDPNRPAERRLVGKSPSMRALRSTLKRIATTDATILVTGPTGSGKELVAEAVHRRSRRANGPLVKVNCAALVETLLLSELFGHEKGAFTGASVRRRGRFEVAEGGTLFLDEIGDISPRTQVALLRVLQDGAFERVGGCTQLHANVRIVCATHRDLRGMVERGEFREDLYYRLCGVVLEVPALRDRLADVPLLARALLEPAAREAGLAPKPLSQSAQRGLMRHTWPGNVRELQNALRVALLFARGDEIELCDFAENVEGLRHLADDFGTEGTRSSDVSELRRGDSSPPDTARAGFDSRPPSGQLARLSSPLLSSPRLPSGLDGEAERMALGASSTDMVYAELKGGVSLSDMKRQLEQECIARALVDSDGNITRAAKLLGMKRPRLSQLVKQYNLASVLEDIKS
jgi:sigma-54 specific flagellar transcriptional regulator A